MVRQGHNNPRVMIDTRGNHLQDLLDEQTLSVSALAGRAGVADETVRRLIDEQPVRRNKFLAIAKALRVPPEKLLPGWRESR